MRWIYWWQQRLAITRPEATAVLTLALLFFVGLGLRRWQQRPRPVPAAAYAEAEALLAAGTAPPRALRAAADTLPATRDTVPAGEPVSRPPVVDAEEGARVDLNAATADELEALPRIGPALAQRILAYRAAHGPFRRVEDLLYVRGIGPKTLARLSPLVTVGEATP